MAGVNWTTAQIYHSSWKMADPLLTSEMHKGGSNLTPHLCLGNLISTGIQSHSSYTKTKATKKYGQWDIGRMTARLCLKWYYPANCQRLGQRPWPKRQSASPLHQGASFVKTVELLYLLSKVEFSYRWLLRPGSAYTEKLPRGQEPKKAQGNPHENSLFKAKCQVCIWSVQ